MSNIGVDTILELMDALAVSQVNPRNAVFEAQS